MRGPIVVTGGGTGGHIFPMQAIGEALMDQGVEASSLRYVGSRRGQESRILGEGPVALTLLPGRGIQRSLSPRAFVDNLAAILRLFSAFVVGFVKVGRWRPSVVVSVGGYASFAVSTAAVLWRRPLILVEFDAAPGAAQRILRRFASLRCTAFVSSEARTVHTGTPLRQEIESIDRSSNARLVARQRALPPIASNRHVVVVMTGSLGAKRVNDAVVQLAEQWRERDDVTILHVTGRRDYAIIQAQAPAASRLDYRIIEFGDMATLWSLCDVAICRAGAMTIAELTALGIASILVPLPSAPGDHQTKNAQVLVDVGAARLVRDAECNAPRLARELDEIFENENTERMSIAAASLASPYAASRIAHEILRARRS